MWQAIFTAGLVVYLVRACPGFFEIFAKIKEYPRLNKFLDYTICLITGEVIYSIAFKGIPTGDNFYAHYYITAITIFLAGTLMLYTAKLSKSLLLSISFFVISYAWLC